MSLEQAQDRIEELYLELHKRLFLYAMATLGNKALAEEAVQDTFRVACVKPDDLMKSENPSGWIFNVLKNILRNIQRYQQKNERLLGMLVVLNKTASAGPDSEAENLALQYADVLSEEMELFRLLLLEERTFLDAALCLNISVEACRKRSQRLRKKLRKIIKENV